MMFPSSQFSTPSVAESLQTDFSHNPEILIKKLKLHKRQVFKELQMEHSEIAQIEQPVPLLK